ncbi:hypothetical protein AAFF_G00135850 [Aldrovandia affinis]|uniref:THUMP domain-containing protein n=1 Tax=Aldrovandia affinis TaxID=143900 RepID=A0AAD7W9V7_9TELE|nr:hypothetical protein AAFF_G00135850 [Aldrovandia affinis]
MKEPSCASQALRYYCTVGKGLEKFLAAEVQCKLTADNVEHVTGKVFFTTRVDIEKVKGLKSAERLFLLLRRQPPLARARMTVRRHLAEELIQDQVIGEQQVWTEGLTLWRSLRTAKERTDPDRNGKDAGWSRKRKREQGESDGQQPGCEGQGRVERRGSGAPPVAFRVCCRSSGSIARQFSFQDLGRIIGIAISKQLGWRVNLREPDLEVNVHLSDDHCVVGLPLSRLPLASRSYIKTTGLRSTVAWAMGSLAEIKPGSCVLDPMCGVGTLLLEAAKECPNSFFLGMDVDESQLEKARGNVRFAELAERVELMQSSVTAIPVPSCSVDAVICDIPFGRKFGSKTDMATALPAIVNEMERVLRVDGALVLLLSPALSSILKRSRPPQPAAPDRQPGEPPQGARDPASHTAPRPPPRPYSSRACTE